MISENQINSGLENIYISPLEKCNLNCRLCYTKKTENILSNQLILDFVGRYQKEINLKSILFCGGEVFTLPDFTGLINQLTDKNIFLTIITNGTIDRLEEIKNPQNCQILISIDGPEKIHDENRGQGNFKKSLCFITKAQSLGFPVEAMFLVTPKSYPYLKTFSLPIKINYITQKTNFYTDNHPLAESKDISGLSPEQIIELKKNYPTVPKKDFGCFQLSLQSNGLIYGCCESPNPIAKIEDPIGKITEKFKENLETCKKCGQCQGCCNPNFLCGYIGELGVKRCYEVIELFHGDKSSQQITN